MATVIDRGDQLLYADLAAHSLRDVTQGLSEIGNLLLVLDDPAAMWNVWRALAEISAATTALADRAATRSDSLQKGQ